MIDYPRHKTGRAYARALEIIGYVVAVLGVVSGLVTMSQVSIAAGLGYLLGSVVTGIGLFVLGELVLTFFHIEYNTTIMREQIVAQLARGQVQPGLPASETAMPAHPRAHDLPPRNEETHGR